MAVPDESRAVARSRFAPRDIFLWVCVAIFALPTFYDVARESWATEQGGHGPIVFAIAIWLAIRELPAARAVARPGSPLISAILLALLLPLYALARITGTLEVESFVMYAVLLVVAYALYGIATLRQLWFPFVFMLFAFPPPDTVYAALTQPLKIAISQWALTILHALGYPVAGSGVTLQIGQYQLLVAAACAGVNSLISLSALGLFYSYIRHRSNWPYMVGLIVCIVPIAVFVNLLRVLLLLLITYYFGEAAGQGFFHEFAGMTMFMLALVTILAIDWIAKSVLPRRFSMEKAA